jgi:uncharacterized membrane protein
LAGLALVFALLFAAQTAWARTLTFERFDAELQLNPDGTFDVTETMVVRFTGAWNGIYRTIPLEYRTQEGFDYRLNVSVEEVTDENYAALRYEKSREGGNLKVKIYVPVATDTTRTIKVKYRVANGLRFFADHDELYWNITGNEHRDTMEESSAQVLLPAGTTGMRVRTFTGPAGARESNATAELADNKVLMATTQALGPREGFTIVVGWDKGFVTPPSPLRQSLDFYRSNWPFLIPVAALILAVWFYFAHGRDPALRPIAVQYSPPGEISPAGAGTLIDDSADMREITATIVDLAVRGYILIEEKQRDRLLGLTHSKDYVLHLRKPVAEWPGARAHERTLLGGLFGGGVFESVALSDLENKFYTHLPLLRDGIFSELLARHYYRTRPDTMHARYAAGAIGAGMGIYFVGSVIARHAGMQILPFGIAAALTAIIVFVYGRVVHGRTIEGTRALEGILGFKEFLARVESDHFKKVTMTPEMFEKFLPFAMALGCEKNWSKAFDGIYQQPPQWYQGAGYGTNFYPSTFAMNLSGMTDRMGSVLSSAPQSSGSSGFGGGGSSGGGFGGGDAGGW